MSRVRAPLPTVPPLGGMDGSWHARVPDFEPFDHIEIKTVPRFKSSGLSGDEWRVSTRVRFFFKGEQVREEWFSTMQIAAMFLPARMIEAVRADPRASD